MLHPILADHERAIPINQMPLLLVVRRRLTRNNRMLAHLVRLRNDLRVCGKCRVRIAGVLCVERGAGEFGPVQGWGLLGGVIAEADSEHFGAVGGAEVERIGRVFCGAEFALLQREDLEDGFTHGFEHLVDRVGLFPAGFAAAVGQVGHV